MLPLVVFAPPLAAKSWRRTCAQAQKKQLCFYCRITLLDLHIALICNTTISFYQVRFKHKQPHILSPDLHAAMHRRTRRGVGGETTLPAWKFSEQTLFSGQGQLAQKSWMMTNISIQWKISGQTLFFRASATCSNVVNDKKYIFNTVNSGHTLFFRASAKILRVKRIFQYSENFQDVLCFPGQEQSCSKILIGKKYIQYSVFNAYSLGGDPRNLG